MENEIVVNNDNPAVKRLMEQIVRDGEQSVPMELIYQNSRNRTCRLKVDGKWAVLKCFKVPDPINAYVYTTLRKSKARRSYEFANRLASLGIATPAPLAYAECRDGLKLRHSYYLCDYVDGHEVREWEKNPDAEPMLRALACDMARLHSKGVFHKDFSPGNILYTTDAEGNFTFYYIDLNRMRFDVHDRNVLMQNFRCINLNKPETLRLARYYAEAAGLDVKYTEKVAEKQLDHYISRKRLHNKIKKLLHLRKK